MSTIEDLIAINSKLSTWNLIYRFFEFKWVLQLVGTSIFVLLFFILLIYFLDSNIFLSFLCFIITGILTIYSVRLSNKKQAIIVEKRYKYINLESEKFTYKLIRKIQKEEFQKLFENQDIFTKENILFLIECIKREIEIKNFKYSFLVNSIIILVGIYFGAFLGGFVNFADKLSDYLDLYKSIGIIVFFMLIPTVLCVEMTLLRDLIETKRKNKTRLIRILENIYMEKFCDIK